MLELFPEATSIFILPPPFTEIQKRLEARNTSTADINRRLDEMSTELLQSETYDYRIKYAELDDMKAEIAEIINLEINS